jgi:uncharacterized protein YciI
MAKFVVFTTFSSEELRNQHRPEHRVHLHALVDQGALLLAGPFDDEASGGMMIFEAESAEAVRAMVDADPFTIEGVFATITIRPFTQVAGK